MQDLWHFPRPDDAARIVGTLKVGLVSALAIIEPRRRGKTTFLLEDLAPAALAASMTPLYINLAATSGGLEAYLAAAVRTAVVDAGGALTSLKALGKARVKKISGKASLVSAQNGGEIELDPASPHGELAAAFGELAALRKDVVFLLDEVHRLGESTARDVAWSLRSLLDTHRKSMKVIATSSSAASYELLVSGEKRAFNRWFTRTSLAPLGDAFVGHLAAVTRQHFPKHGVTKADLAAAFAALGHSPKFLRDYLNQRILNPGMSHDAALMLAAAEAARESGHEDAFVRLVPLQKIVLVAIASGQKELFGEATLKAVGSVLTGEPVSKTLMQKAQRSLAMNGWIIRAARGEYLLADSLFEQWLGEQIKTGLLPAPAPIKG